MSANLFTRVFQKVMKRKHSLEELLLDCLTPKCDFFPSLGNMNYSNSILENKNTTDQKLLGRATETKHFIKNQVLAVVSQPRQEWQGSV